MKHFKTVRRVGAAALASTVGLVGSASAAVPAAITGAIADMQADGLTVAGACVTAGFLVYAVKFMWRSKT